jgi:hypothetical protein
MTFLRALPQLEKEGLHNLKRLAGRYKRSGTRQ